MCHTEFPCELVRNVANGRLFCFIHRARAVDH